MRIQSKLTILEILEHSEGKFQLFRSCLKLFEDLNGVRSRKQLTLKYELKVVGTSQNCREKRDQNTGISNVSTIKNTNDSNAKYASK